MLNKKAIVAWILDIMGISDLLYRNMNEKYSNNYIRVINYHEVENIDLKMFEKHLAFYKKRFANCNLEMLDYFIQGEKYYKDKPGLMITFDDGYQSNYENALPLLDKYGFTGWFMISSRKIGGEYMTNDELVELVKRNHVVGCHTATHHRMNINDSKELIRDEIINSKSELERIIENNVEIFCWVGGERGTYTKSAYEAIIEAGYKYAFMTDSYPVLHYTNPYHIQRTNIQAYWDLPIVKFQLCGLIDWKYRKKRKIEELETT